MNKPFAYVIAMLFSTYLCAASGTDRMGEINNYRLNGSRSSWVITGGNARATFKDYRVDDELGPIYVVRVDYQFDVRLYGQEKGGIDLLVPAEPREIKQFYQPVDNNKRLYKCPVQYLAPTPARDANGKLYDPCVVARIVTAEGFEITLKGHPSIQTLGGVQIDIKGKILGIAIKAGLDLVP